MSLEHPVSASLMSFRLGVSQPIGEAYCSQHLVVIGDECVLGYLSSKVAEARVGHDLSWIVFRFEKLSCQIILLPPLRPGHVDVAVLWILESNLRHRTGDVIRCDRLHEHI